MLMSRLYEPLLGESYHYAYSPGWVSRYYRRNRTQSLPGLGLVCSKGSDGFGQANVCSVGINTLLAEGRFDLLKRSCWDKRFCGWTYIIINTNNQK